MVSGAGDPPLLDVEVALVTSFNGGLLPLAFCGPTLLALFAAAAAVPGPLLGSAFGLVKGR